MLAASILSLEDSNHIRKVDITRDLDTIADLIEMCFPIHLDRDGQKYLQQMRRAARDMRIMGWLATLSELGSSRVSGFVWEEGGKIVGNLSLIPFKRSGKVFHMIANVAVHPDHRRQGIARALTERALGYLRRRNEPYVWLQVRDDNRTAYNLYRSAGFLDRFTRTTWHIRPFEMSDRDADSRTSINLRYRRPGDWATQKAWLGDTYPVMMRWNLPVNFRRFEPGFLQGLSNILDGVFCCHWAVESAKGLLGAITWQKTDSFANNLWLAFPEKDEEQVLRPALRMVLKHVPRKHPLAIDYPKGRCSGVFESLGFHYFRTLVWMCRDL